MALMAVRLLLLVPRLPVIGAGMHGRTTQLLPRSTLRWAVLVWLRALHLAALLNM